MRALLALLGSGAKDETIARELGLSERTLRRRSADLLRRLGAANRFQAGARRSAAAGSDRRFRRRTSAIGPRQAPDYTV